MTGLRENPNVSASPRDVGPLRVPIPERRIERRRVLEQLRQNRRRRKLTWDRPKCRADCIKSERPCPWVGCRWNLYLDVNPRNGSITLNFPDLAPEDMPAWSSCMLDLAEDGEHTLEEIGQAMNLTRERVRQLEYLALRKLDGREELDDWKPRFCRLEEPEPELPPEDVKEYYDPDSPVLHLVTGPSGELVDGESDGLWGRWLEVG